MTSSVASCSLDSSPMSRRRLMMSLIDFMRDLS